MADRVDLNNLRRLGKRAPWVAKQPEDEPLILAAADEIHDLRNIEQQHIAFREEAVETIRNLHALIAKAPHGYECASGTMMNVEEFFPCDCWKSEV
jgi:hypothetical protein